MSSRTESMVFNQWLGTSSILGQFHSSDFLRVFFTFISSRSCSLSLVIVILPIIIPLCTAYTTPKRFYFFFRGRLLNIHLFLSQFSIKFIFVYFKSFFLSLEFRSFFVSFHPWGFQLNLLF